MRAPQCDIRRVAGSVRQQMQADLPAAIKARDASRVSVLRTTLAALANAEAVDLSGPRSTAGLLGDVERKLLSERDMREIVSRERAELWAAAAEEMERLGQRREAVELETRAGILESYLAL